MTLTASPGTIVAGQTVTFTATVAGGTPADRSGETVTFKAGATTLGTATLDASGRAVFSTNTLRAGTYAVVASYNGEPNYLPSNSPTVTYAVTAPLGVTNVQIDTGGSQRSMVRSLTVTFNGPATIATGAFDLIRVGGGPVGLNVATQLLGGRTVATLTFRDSTEPGSGSLADGNYQLTIHGDRVTDSFNQQLDGDGNGFIGGDRVTSFFRLYGDVNGDRAMNLSDLAVFRGAFGTIAGDSGYLDYLDFNGDGVINLTDLTQFRNRFRAIFPP